jgi:hypothetical protein
MNAGFVRSDRGVTTNLSEGPGHVDGCSYGVPGHKTATRASDSSVRRGSDNIGFVLLASSAGLPGITRRASQMDCRLRRSLHTGS